MMHSSTIAIPFSQEFYTSWRLLDSYKSKGGGGHFTVQTDNIEQDSA